MAYAHHVVIIGGGFGGLYAARSLCQAPVRVTLIDRRNFHLFQPLLYQVATGGLSPANIASPLRYVLKRQKNTRVLLAEAVEVMPDLSVPGYRDVFVIGDLALYKTPSGPLPGTAPVAMQEGRYVAELIMHRLRGKTLPPFQYKHKGDMATIGRAAGVADLKGIHLSGFAAWLAWLFVHLWYLIEFEDRLLVFLQWAWNYATRNRGARLITGEGTAQVQPPL